MPVTLSKLPCGVIYTDAFQNWLERMHEEKSPDHPHRMLTLDYVRCASGPQRGRAWWQVLWVPLDAIPSHRVFRVGRVPVHVPKPAQIGLRERCLDCENDQVVVRP